MPLCHVGIGVPAHLWEELDAQELLVSWLQGVETEGLVWAAGKAGRYPQWQLFFPVPLHD